LEEKSEDVPGENRFGFRRGRGTRDVTETLRKIPQRTV
jgi:hypothetical protein